MSVTSVKDLTNLELPTAAFANTGCVKSAVEKWGDGQLQHSRTFSLAAQKVAAAPWRR